MKHPQQLPGIPIDEVMKRLMVSRNYITRNVTHCVKHIESSPAQGAKVWFEENSLRQYLMSKAVFSRQTKRINIESEIKKYVNEHRLNKRPDVVEFIGDVPRIEKSARSEIPAIKLPSKDFWDFDLLFPKDYTQGDLRPDATKKDSEIFYRDMFMAGAVKIQLGKQKSMFFIPGDWPLSILLATHPNTPECFLVPADWEPFYKGISQTDDSPSKTINLEITVKGGLEAFPYSIIENLMRKIFVIDRTIHCGVDSKEEFASIEFSAHIPENPADT